MRRLNRKKYSNYKKPKAPKDEKLNRNKHYEDDSTIEVGKMTTSICQLRYGHITHCIPEYLTKDKSTIIMGSWVKYIVSCIELLWLREQDSEKFFETLALYGVLSKDVLIALENIAETEEIHFDNQYKINHTGYNLYLADLKGKTLYPVIIGISRAIGIDIEECTFTISKIDKEKAESYKILLGDRILVEDLEVDVAAFILVSTMCKVVGQQSLIESSCEGLRLATVPEDGATEVKGIGLYMWFSGNVEDLREYISKLNMFIEENLKLV